MADTDKKGYWWECESCEYWEFFPGPSKSSSIANFIWDELLPNGWNQSCLVRECKECRKKALRIAYYLNPNDKGTIVRVVHIVGLEPWEEKHIRMMWGFYFVSEPQKRYFDFKYINSDRNHRGLVTPAHFDREELRRLFVVYKEKTEDTSNFP